MAAIISRLIFLRYGSKQLQIEGLPCLWTDCVLEPGDIVSLVSSIVPDRPAGALGIPNTIHGITTPNAFEILDRTWNFMAGIVTFKVLQIDLSKFKQFLFTPNAEANFTADTALNKAKYLYLSDANTLYSDGSPGNTLC